MSRKLSNIEYIAVVVGCLIVGGSLGLNFGYKMGREAKMAEKTEIKFCTSCGSDQIEVTGSNYYCKQCDVTFKVTKAGTRVVETDPLGKERSRIDQLEKDVEQLKGPKKDDQPAEPEPGAKDDVNYHGQKNEQEEQEPEGFITFE